MNKNLIIYLSMILGVLTFVSCEKDEIIDFHSPSDSDASYVQWTASSTTPIYYVNKLNAAGEYANATFGMTVKLVGSVSSSASTVSYTISTTDLPAGYNAADPAMYQFSSDAFVVEAGASTGSLSLTLVNLELPLADSVSFVMTLNAPAGTTVLGEESMIITMYKKD